MYQYDFFQDPPEFNDFYDTDIKKLSEIVSEFQDYNIYDILSKISSLNLLPQNQNKCIIFDALINSIITMPREQFCKDTIISNSKFKRIINSCSQLNLNINIDPSEIPFINRIRFFGNHWLFSGINTDVAFHLQTLIDVIFLHENNLSKEFIYKCQQIMNTILFISTTIINDLGYGIDTLGNYNCKEIAIPDAATLSKLQRHTIFNLADLKRIADFSIFESIFIDFGENNNATNLYNDNYNFYYQPCLKLSEEQFIVLNPSMLAIFAIHTIIKLSDEYNIRKKLIERYNYNAWSNCNTAFLRLGHKPIREEKLGIKLLVNRSYREELYNVCNDGILFVQYICDDGKRLIYNNIFEQRIFNSNKISRRYQKIKSILSKHQINIYQVIILNTFGRGILLSFHDEQCEKILNVTAFELLCIALNEYNHVNFIPRFLERKCQLFNPHFAHLTDITLISMYTHNNYSFYFDDQTNINENTILMPDFSQTVDYLNKAIKSSDRQLIESPDHTHWKEISLCDAHRNIYCTINNDETYAINRFNNIDIFINSIVTSDTNIQTVTHTIVDMISYWLGELKITIESCSFSIKSIIIVNIFENEISPSIPICKDDKSLHDVLKTEKIHNQIKLFWSNESVQHLFRNETSYENELIELIIEYISSYATNHIDLGSLKYTFTNPLKRKLFGMNYNDQPSLKPVTERARIIPIECEDTLLDEIGSHFVKNKHMPYGEIKQDQSQVCNDIVNYLYNKLTDLLKDIDPLGVYEYIYYDIEKIAYWHTLCQERYAFDITCHPEKANEINKEYSDINKISVSIKFLMEYIVAVPLNGTRKLGEMEYEYILALCSMLIEWAHTSDLFKYNIINSKINILKSNRIGYKKNQLQVFIDCNYEASTKRLSLHSDPRSNKFSQKRTIEKLGHKIDDAFIDEYEYSYTDFYCCIMEILNIGDSIPNEVKVMDQEQLLHSIHNNTQIEISTIKKIVNELTLKKRTVFLNPEPPYNSNDVYPWRYNRRLSLNRKPLIQLNNTILWGNRQLFLSYQFVKHLILDGSFKSSRPKMKTLIGEIAKLSGDEFNDLVADKIKSFDKFIVTSKVSKINGQKIQGNNKNTLGDIDVLIINPLKKKIIVAEVKNFSLKKSPYEIYQEYLSVFCDSEKSKCYLSKHKARVDWVKAHISDVVSQYKLPKGNWKVDDVMIVNEIIVSNQYYHKKQKILLYSEITEKSISNI